MAKELTARQRLRKNFLWLHRWLGIISGLVVFIITGLLVWLGRKNKVKKNVRVMEETVPATLYPVLQ